MWRVIPLAKIVLRMLVFGVILGVAQGLFTTFMYESSISAPRAYFNLRIMKAEVVNAAILSALIGVSLATYAGVIHQTIHKPQHFKFAFVLIATIVSLGVVRESIHIVALTSLGISAGEWFQVARIDLTIGIVWFVVIAKHVAVGMMSLYVAGRYLRDANANFMKSTVQTSD